MRRSYTFNPFQKTIQPCSLRKTSWWEWSQLKQYKWGIAWRLKRTKEAEMSRQHWRYFVSWSLRREKLSRTMKKAYYIIVVCAMLLFSSSNWDITLERCCRRMNPSINRQRGWGGWISYRCNRWMANRFPRQSATDPGIEPLVVWAPGPVHR